ncbi:hypothetical protein D3C80_1766970 [compost metagenome]
MACEQVTAHWELMQAQLQVQQGVVVVQVAIAFDNVTLQSCIQAAVVQQLLDVGHPVIPERR